MERLDKQEAIHFLRKWMIENGWDKPPKTNSSEDRGKELAWRYIENGMRFHG